MADEQVKGLDTDSDRSQESEFKIPAVSLPKGGGAIRGIDEKFAVSTVTGTGSFSIPVTVSPGRSGFTPSIELRYDSGSGNTAFGFGWIFQLPMITRKTARGVPRYVRDEDVFILSGAEDLVAVQEWTGHDWRRAEKRCYIGDTCFTVRRYRPRVEGLYARIERWANESSGEVHWRSTTAGNVTSVYGDKPGSRIADPADASHVFSWLLSTTYDDKGNVIIYDYKPEDDANVDVNAPNELGRSTGDRTANRYPKRIRYGNTVSRLVDPTLESSSWLFEVVLDYGEHNANAPTPREERKWPCRPDPFSSFRAGFEIRTYRLCHRILVFHHFPGETGSGTDCLVRSTDLRHADDRSSRSLLLSYLKSVTERGYRRRPKGGYIVKSLPPVQITYSEAVISDEVHVLDADSATHLPGGIDGDNYRLTDIDGNGLQGILIDQAGAWFYKPNLGDGHFGPPRLVDPVPRAVLAEPRVQLMDLVGDGRPDVARLDAVAPGFYERDNDGDGWLPFRPFARCPRVSWNDPNLRFADLDGDGLADILLTQDDGFWWYRSLGGYGFAPAEHTSGVCDEDQRSHLIFADGTQSLYLADMSGDQLPDLVRIRNGEVCYWPNLGRGRFGKRIVMSNSPWLDRPERFDQRRVRLGDIDGSGTTDVIYLGDDNVDLYLNRSGNSFTDRQQLTVRFPAADNLAQVEVTDLLGKGTACLVWSSPLPAEMAARSVQYIDLMAGGKPHILTSISNSLGSETHISYAPSTKFYLSDQAAGRDWVGRLPFVVQVVDRLDVIDRISGNRLITRYSYHHGYYDGVEREFRGFGLVDKEDAEEFALLQEGSASLAVSNEDTRWNIPPVLTRTWNHTGAPGDGTSLSHQHEAEYWYHNDHRLTLEDTPLPHHVRTSGHRIPWDLSPEEIRQARRALRGSVLRQEIYALDGTGAANRPYVVHEANFTVELLQPALSDSSLPPEPDDLVFAILAVHPRETITAHYERKLYRADGRMRPDPVVTHDLVLSHDDFGNALQSAAIAYGRSREDASDLPDEADRRVQRRSHVTYRQNQYTHAIDGPEGYRTPANCMSRSYEIVGLLTGVSERPISFSAVETTIAELADGHHDIGFEQWAAAGEHRAGTLLRRPLSANRRLFRRDDLTGPLPFGVLEPLALPYESYRLALTGALVSHLYDHRANGVLLADTGGYVQIDGLDGWWTPSGRLLFSPDPADGAQAESEFARRHFFMPSRYRSPFGDITTIIYDDYSLLRRETRDAAGNRVTAGVRDRDGRFIVDGNDYRVLQPWLVMDANRNRAAVAFDALGMVVGTAVMGKPEESLGDSLDGFDPDLDDDTIAAYAAEPLAIGQTLIAAAGSRLIYDLHAYMRTRGTETPEPPFVATIARERHASELSPGGQSRVHHVISYSDGFARDIQKKVQSEAGPLTEDGPVCEQRWIGTGWTIFDNKGNAVRRFEPFFSATHRFENSRVAGVSTTRFFDPLDRVVGTLHPDQTWEKVVFDPWSHETWDANDTVLLDPRADTDVGSFFRRALADDPGWQTWYRQRITGKRGADDERAARRASIHAATPARAWFDALSHPIANTAHNRFERDGTAVDEYQTTRALRDVQGNQRMIIDTLGRTAMRFDYDMLGKAVVQASSGSGTRIVLADVGGSTAVVWNSRGFRIRHTYDSLRRPVGEYVAQDDGSERLVERTVYGENSLDSETGNLRGKSYLQFDGSGVVIHGPYDFKGNLLKSTRRVTRDYRHVPAWGLLDEYLQASSLDLATLDSELDALLETEQFTGATSYDAYNRPTEVAAPDGSAAELTYNDGTLLERVNVRIQGVADTTAFVTNIDYNARGERVVVDYGNGTSTQFTFDPETFRLERLFTHRPGHVLQDYTHVFDPVGNVVIVRDGVQHTVFHDNQAVSGDSSYTYDALYQLIQAEGREQRGQNDVPDGRDSPVGRIEDHVRDHQAMRRYTEHYRYDPAGNLLQLVHAAARGGWTRSFVYEETSELDPGQTSDRLSSTMVGENTRHYSYDRSGNTTVMPGLHGLSWDHGDQLTVADLEGSGHAYYSYDTAGRRVRKTVEHDGIRQAERIYVGGFEVYRRFDESGRCELQRNTVHVYDNQERLALVEVTTVDNGEPSDDASVAVRFQLTNGARSVTLEVDGGGQVISYEEYHPFGTTSYRAARGVAEVSLKRYRYNGKERDEETGFYYYGARYYVPWLARWASCDPAGMVDGSNLYRYVKNNPVNFTDPTGQWEMPSWRTVAVVAAVVVVGTVVTIATAGVAGPVVVGAIASIGLSGTAATVVTGAAVGAIAGAVGGAAAGAAGEATRQTVNSKALGLGDEEFSGTKIVNSAVKDAKTGALIGAAVGGAAATGAGSALIGGAGKLAQRFAPGLTKAGVSAATAIAKRTGVTALSKASEKIGLSAAKSLFQEGSSGAQAIATFADTGNLATTFGAGPKPPPPAEIPPAVTPVQEAAAAPAVPEAPAGAGATSPGRRIGAYEDTGGHHLNQDAAYRDVIPHEKGVAIELEGNAFTQPGTPHYEAHADLEQFWNQFRRGGARFGEMPTNLEYTRALQSSLRAAGLSEQEVRQAVRAAIRQRVDYGLLGGESVPRIPGRINQVKP